MLSEAVKGRDHAGQASCNFVCRMMYVTAKVVEGTCICNRKWSVISADQWSGVGGTCAPLEHAKALLKLLH